jgi:prepilin-type N-terminal cleavage/methylation domain-containing protein
MIRFRLLQRLKKRWLASRKHRIAGFTLIEILVSLLIGAIITAALLSLVVDLTDTNLKDTSRSETQRDMQAALNYIAQDLREAVYVYDGACLLTGNGTPNSNNYATTCPGLANYIAPNVTQAPNYPVLAFWRPDTLPPVVQAQCRAAANSPVDPILGNVALQNLVGPTNPVGADGVPCASGKSYTLVVYGITQGANNGWQGRARLTRYKLTQFQGNSTTMNTGWTNPQYDANSGFQQWPFRSDGTQAPGYAQATNNGDMDVLVDFVDDTQVNSLPTNQQPNCVSPSVMTPPTPTFASFFACVRGNTLNAITNSVTPEIGINQEVLVVLEGNVSGRAGFPNSNNNVARLSPLQTRVLVRGILNKQPS